MEEINTRIVLKRDANRHCYNIFCPDKLDGSAIATLVYYLMDGLELSEIPSLRDQLRDIVSELEEFEGI